MCQSWCPREKKLNVRRKFLVILNCVNESNGHRGCYLWKETIKSVWSHKGIVTNGNVTFPSYFHMVFHHFSNDSSSNNLILLCLPLLQWLNGTGCLSQWTVVNGFLLRFILHLDGDLLKCLFKVTACNFFNVLLKVNMFAQKYSIFQTLSYCVNVPTPPTLNSLAAALREF